MSNLIKICVRRISRQLKLPITKNISAISNPRFIPATSVQVTNTQYYSNRKLPTTDQNATDQKQQNDGSSTLDLLTYESVCSETLEGLCEYFDYLVETDSAKHLQNSDITYSVSG